MSGQTPGSRPPGPEPALVETAAESGRTAPAASPSPNAGTPTTGRKRGVAFRPSAAAPIVVATPTLDRTASQVSANPTAARRFVVKEIVDTEEVFVQDILRTISGFLMPLRTQPKLISAVEMGKLFANIEMILITSSEMAKELRAAVTAAPTPEEAQIGAVFSKNANTLESAFAQCTLEFGTLLRRLLIYLSADCRANSEALQLLARLQKKTTFASTVEALEVTDGTTGLLSYLVKPVQRVCKYPLLLRELQKNTPPEHPDSVAVGVALESIGRLVDKVNQTAKETENISNLLRVESQLSDTPSSLKLIMPGRKFVREGRWMKISGRNTQERQVYLFNDMLIYAKPAVLAKNKFVFKGIIPLHSAKIEAHGEPGTQLANSIKITRSDNNKEYILFDEYEEESRDEWLADISVSLGGSNASPASSDVVGAFHIAETSPDARRDAVTILGIETRISGWSNDNPQRRFVASGPLKYVLAGSSDSSSDIEHRGFLFLFNDSAVFARQVKNVQARVPFQHKESVEFSSASIQDADLVDLDGDKSVFHAFLLSSQVKQRRAALLFPSLEEKLKWMDLLSSLGVAVRTDVPESGASSPRQDDQPASSPLSQSPSSPGTLRSGARLASVSGVRLPAGVSPRGSFVGDGVAGVKTKKSFFGKKLGYITQDERRPSAPVSVSGDGSEALDDSLEEPDEGDKRESVEGFEIPPWDADDSADSCNACGSRFSTTNRKHHCRNCGKLFDSKCTTKKCMLPRYGWTKKKVRVCDSCFADH